jgi:hypothetical protein
MRQTFLQVKKGFTVIAITTAISVAIAGCEKDDKYDKYPPEDPKPEPKSVVVKGSGDISGQLAEFRAILGEPLNGTPNQTTGRREVNWDGVPANLTNNNNFPFDFFNVTDPAGPNGRKRGLVMNNATTFRVDTTGFSEIDASYAAEFKAFSPKRAFADALNNVSTAFFKVPGTNTDAFIRGFGVIFSDVDNANSTTMEFYSGNKSLGVFKVPVRSDANGFSFLGVHFPEEKVTRVKITSGNSALGAGIKDVSAGGVKDLVVMDDFFYNEPLENK